MRCWQNADGCKARDEGRSQDYDAEERNDADAAFCRNPHGTAAATRSAKLKEPLIKSIACATVCNPRAGRGVRSAVW